MRHKITDYHHQSASDAHTWVQNTLCLSIHLWSRGMAFHSLMLYTQFIKSVQAFPLKRIMHYIWPVEATFCIHLHIYEETNIHLTAVSTKSFTWDSEAFVYDVKTLLLCESPLSLIIGGDSVEMTHYTASYCTVKPSSTNALSLRWVKHIFKVSPITWS